MKSINQYWISKVCVVVLLSLSSFRLHGFESKWARVDSLAREIEKGSIASRLENKNKIINILMKQESDYPLYFVDVNASGSKDGGSWQNAFTNIQDAIDAAAEDGEGWVWVAGGTYSADDHHHHPQGTIYIESGVMVFGGFAGDETEIRQRDPSKNQTVITGWSMMRAVDMAHKSLIDGFTIRKAGYEDTEGLSSLDVAGGGIRTLAWFAIIRNCRIYNCHGKDGGGVSVYAKLLSHRVVGYSPIIDNNVIYNNTGVCGAGAHIRNSEVLFSHNVVYGNYAISFPDRRYFSKGIEILLNREISDPCIIVNSIILNHADHNIIDLIDPNNGADGDGVEVEYCCTTQPTNGWSEMIFNQDPLFVNASAGDFSLKPGSPCIDAGLPDGPRDPDGTRADIGVLPWVTTAQLSIDKNGVNAVVSGDGYFATGTQVKISCDSLVADENGLIQYHFDGWQGTGQGAYTGANRNPLITMNTDILQRVLWKKAYFVDCQTGFSELNSSDWFFEGSPFQCALPSVFYKGFEQRQLFDQWEIAGEPATFVTDTLINFIIDQPTQIHAHWLEEAVVRIIDTSGPNTSTESQWRRIGEEVSFNADSIFGVNNHKRYRFGAWSGDGPGAYSGADQFATLTLNAPVTETANWIPQFTVLIDSFPAVQGHVILDPHVTWADSGSTVDIDAIPSDSTFEFVGWAGTTISDSPRITITVDEPVHLIAQFAKQVVPPDPIPGLPDSSIQEDREIYISTNQLSDALLLENPFADSISYFLLVSSHFQLFLKDDHLELIPESNWFGTDSLVLSIMINSVSAFTDTFIVHVTPQADPPLTFDLLYPESNAELIDTLSQVRFCWQSAKSVDSEDPVLYNLYVSSDSIFNKDSAFLTALADTEAVVSVQHIQGMKYWRVLAIQKDGLFRWASACHQITWKNSTGVFDADLPDEMSLSQNYPNPFNQSTRISYQLSHACKVTAMILDARGRKIATVVDEEQQPGAHSVTWSGRNASGADVSSGIYLLQMNINGQNRHYKMLLIR